MIRSGQEASVEDSGNGKICQNKGNKNFANHRIDNRNVSNHVAVRGHYFRDSRTPPVVIRSDGIVELPESNPPNKQLENARSKEIR